MIHVLSPHRDDAVFSLFFTLSALARDSAALMVSNFFTVSGYAPRAGASDPAVISAIRKREDRAALRRVSRSLRVRDFDLLDAPLRLSIPASRVCYTAINCADVDLVMRYLGSRTALTFAPLGLGGHVDHLTVKHAALRGFSPARLAFYEDLPYAMWSDAQLAGVLAEIEDKLHTHFKPVVVRARRNVLEKRAACAHYQSQIRPDEAAAMADWSRRYGTGERIWCARECSIFD